MPTAERIIHFPAPTEQYPEPDKSTSKKPKNYKIYLMQHDTFFAGLGAEFHPAGDRYYQVRAFNGKNMRFDAEWIVNSPAWFKEPEDKKEFTRDDVMWIIYRYLDTNKPRKDLGFLLSNFRVMQKRHIAGKVNGT